LAPGERVVIVENAEAFALRYDDPVLVAGQFTGGLGNSNERIVLMAGDQVLADFRYSDDWHPTTDGDGPSLQAVNEAADANGLGTAAAWRPSRATGGSPGKADGPLVGDVNHDNIFNSSDLLAALTAGKYEDLIADNASFDEGDRNEDGDFDTGDLVLAFQLGHYEDDLAPLDAIAADDAMAADAGTSSIFRRRNVLEQDTELLPQSSIASALAPALDHVLARDGLDADNTLPHRRRRA
jgi:hypothetical protein